MTGARDRPLSAHGPALRAALIAGALALVYVLVAPVSGDLAAHAYRADLFGRVGFALWDNGWYGGHPTLAYSVLFPPLGWLLGVRLAGALAVTAAAGAFALLVSEDRHRGAPAPGAPLAGAWFAVGVAEWLLAGRMPFLLGTALGLTALVALMRSRLALALVAGLACTLASPLAGAFLLLAAAALAIAPADGRDGAGLRLPRRDAIALGAAALAPLALLTVAFDEGGREPFAASSFWPGLALTLLVLALLPRQRRTLRVGTALYAGASIAAFVVPSAAGGNVARLGPLFGGPLVVAALWPRRRLVVLALILPLAYWQLQAPARDAATGAGDSSVSASYYRPLLRWLAGRPGPVRIEIPFTRLHWEAARVAPAVAIARGWERQLDIELNPIFYAAGGRLGSGAYERWLHANAIAYVALPDVALDYSGRAEGALVASRPAYLEPVWSSAHWRVFAVAGAAALASAPATLTALSPQSLTLRFARAGTSLVRVRFSRYWRVRDGAGCVARAPGGYTSVTARRPGAVRVVIGFDLSRVLADGSRCG